MTNLRQAAQQALEALEWAWGGEPLTGKEMVAIAALRAALAEPEPIEDVVMYGSAWSKDGKRIDPMSVYKEPEQPVAWMCPDDPDRATAFAWRYGYCIECGKPRIPLYTAPTPRKPLTDDEIERVCAPLGAAMLSFTEVARAIERAHGIGEQT